MVILDFHVVRTALLLCASDVNIANSLVITKATNSLQIIPIRAISSSTVLTTLHAMTHWFYIANMRNTSTSINLSLPRAVLRELQGSKFQLPVGSRGVLLDVESMLK